MPAFRNRVLFLATILSVVFLIVVLRFFILQSNEGDDLLKDAVAQQRNGVLLFRERGDILDRKGIPFTNREGKTLAVFPPGLPTFSGSNDGEGSDTAPYAVPVSSEEISSVAAFHPNIVFADIPVRYAGRSLAAHVTGYLRKSDGTGISSLEEKFNSRLSGSSIMTAILADATRKPLPGSGIRLLKADSGNAPLDLRLTLDYSIQRIVEDEMDNLIPKGAVVVMDAMTGDVLAMASRPDFDREDVDAAMSDPDGSSLFNRAVAAYSPGSVFKIVDAAAALEEGLYSRYRCNGSISFGSLHFRCYDGTSHGELGLEQAFVQSCNTFFIRLGIDVGAEKILAMAARLGLGKSTGIQEQGIAESSGHLPSAREAGSYGDAANISIGQGEVSVTPLQAAAMVCAIASHGVLPPVNVTDALLDQNGNIVQKLRSGSARRVIPAHVARMLEEMMYKVTGTVGTGSRANLDDIGGAAGKTGSAEAVKSDGSPTVHAWFVGYFPVEEEPRTVISVFVEDGGMGGDVSAPVFAAIARKIHALNLLRQSR